MSPHAVNSFVTDLVEMAKAMERVPSLEAALFQAQTSALELSSRITELEVSLEASRTYASGLEQKVHDAEASRDDAELRFLELDEKADKVLAWLEDSESANRNIRLMLDPPKPKPIVETKPEPEHVEIHSWADEPVSSEPVSHWASLNEVSVLPHDWQQDKAETSTMPQGLSEPSEGKDQSDPTTGQNSYAESEVGNSSVKPLEFQSSIQEPSPGPYSGKRYYDMPTWVSREDWLAGGGTEYNYDWRPNSGYGSF